MKNRGIDWGRELQEQSTEDWVFGAASQPCIAEIPEGARELYLPRGERQNIGEDKMDCVTRAFLNTIETKLNWLVRMNRMTPENQKWSRENGYMDDSMRPVELSDAYIAILSGTTRSGNSLLAPLKAIHEHGVIPKSMLPQLESWDENYDPSRITEEMKKLGKEFLARFPMNFERVYEKDYPALIGSDMFVVGLFAWPFPINGVYPRVDARPNHSVMVYRGRYYAFDNYEEGEGDFIKELASDYDFIDYGYRIFIPKENTVENLKTQLGILTRIRDLLILVINLQWLLNSKLGCAIDAWWNWDKTMGAMRSKDWPRVRREHLKRFPTCALCGGDKTIEVHHKKMYSKNPQLELDPNNLITLCESGKNGIVCHRAFGHLGNYQRENPDVVEDVEKWHIKLTQ